MTQSKVLVKMLMAGNGDSIIISFIGEDKRPRNILVDGGNGKLIFKDHLLKLAEQIVESGQKIDLLIITHIDQDHIKGIVYLTREIANASGKLQCDSIGKYWFNSALKEKIFKEKTEIFDISAAEMHDLEKFLHIQPDERWDINDPIIYPETRQLFGAEFTILSPNEKLLSTFIDEYKDYNIGSTSDDYDRSLKELYDIEQKQVDDGKEELDYKLENATSIAFLFEYAQTSFLHLGDGIPTVIDRAIEKLIVDRGIDILTVDAVKLSHHASRKSLSSKFLRLVKTNKYLISANGKKAKLPNKATFAKILLNENRDLNEHIEFYFNYSDVSSELKFSNEEFEKLKFSCYDANFEHGYCLLL